MAKGYGSHKDFVGRVKVEAEARRSAVEKALRAAFSRFIETRQVEVVVFSGMSAHDLAAAIVAHPAILKPLLGSCNIAARAIERDLGIKNVDTYAPRLSGDHANVIAGYIKPFLPDYVELPTLSRIDHILYVDKEIRKGKGRWEQHILKALNQFGGSIFRKRKFSSGGEEFEIDAATPTTGDIAIGVDVKRVEARRDIHKRCDEIVNKADKLKSAYPRATFGVVVYYPFIDEHANVQNRLQASKVDAVVFASEAPDSIRSAVQMLCSTLKVAR